MDIKINVVGNADSSLSKISAESTRATTATTSLAKSFTKLSDIATKTTKATADAYKSSQASVLQSLNSTYTSAKEKLDNLNKTQQDFTEQSTSSSNATATSLRRLATEYIAVSTAIESVNKAVDDFKLLEGLTKEIQKTTGLAKDDLQEFTDELDKTASTVRGMDLQSMYEISAIAGQLGIKGKENLMEFTMEIRKIVATSKLTSEEASESFAKLSNSMQDPISKIANLTSLMTALASNTTANERTLLDFSQRLAGAGKTLGITTAQVAGLGATLSDIGVNAEVGGTAISDLMLKLVTDGDTMAKRVGANMDEFTKAMKDEPIKAVEIFIKALGDLDKTAKVEALKDLKLSGSGLSSTLLKLSANTDKLASNLDIATKAYDNGTATQKEFDVATQGLAVSQQHLADKVTLLSAEFGEMLAPTIESVIDVTSELVDWISRNKEMVVETTQVVVGATVAWKAFSLVMSLSPFGRIIAGLTAVAGLALSVYNHINGINKEIKKTTQVSVEFANKAKKYAEDTAKAQNSRIGLLKQEKAITVDIMRLSGDKAYEGAVKVLSTKLNTVKRKIAELGNETVDAEGKTLNAVNTTTKAKIVSFAEAKKLQQAEAKRVALASKAQKAQIASIEKAQKAQIASIRRAKEAQIASVKKAQKEKEAELKKIQVAEKKRLEELAQLEKERLRKLDNFNDLFNRTTKSTYEYNLDALDAQKKEWLAIGADAIKVQTVYVAKRNELLKEKQEEYQRDIAEQYKKLEASRENTKEIKNQVTALQGVTSVLGDMALGVAKTALTKGLNGVVDFNKSGSANKALISSGDPYVQAIGVLGTVISSGMDDTFELLTNVGADNQSIANSLTVLEEAVNPNLEYNKQIAENTLAMVAGLTTSSQSLALNTVATGADFTASISTSGVLDMFGDFGSALSGAISSKSTELIDSGIRFADILAKDVQKIQAISFQHIRETESYVFGIVSSSKDKMVLGDEVDSSVTSAIGDVLSAGINNILLGANAIAIKNAQDAISTMTISIGDLDFTGKSEAEINEILQGVIGNQLDTIAEAVASEAIGSFRGVGEDYYSTLLRVSQGYEDARATLSRKNIDVIDDISEIVNKQGDVYAEVIRESLTNISEANSGINEIIRSADGAGDELLATYETLIKAQKMLQEFNGGDTLLQVTSTLVNSFEGGVSELNSLQDSLFNNFETDANRLAFKKSALQENLGMEIPATKEAYLELIRQFDTSTEMGAKQYATFLEQQDAYLEYLKLSESVATEAQKAKQAILDKQTAKEEELAKIEADRREAEDKALSERLKLEAKQAKELATKREEATALIKKEREAMQDALTSSMKTISDTIDNTINSISDISNSKAGGKTLVQSMADYSSIKVQIEREMSLPNIDTGKVSELASALNEVSLEVAKGGSSELRDKLQQDLSLFGGIIGNSQKDRMEVVNEADTKLLTDLKEILGINNEDNAESNKLLNEVLYQLEQINNKA